MSDTTTRPGTSRARRLLTATRKAPRKLLVAAATGLIAAAGTAALVAVPAAANAATIVNPNCPLPTTQAWQYEGSITDNLRPEGPLPIYVTTNYWETTYNGVFYTGATLTGGLRGNDTLTPSASSVNGVCAAGNEYAYPE